jgi:hypothetical protein
MAQRKKYSWLIGLNLDPKNPRVEIHRNDPSKPTQVSHLKIVEEYYGIKVPIEIRRRKQQVLNTLMGLDHNSDSR